MGSKDIERTTQWAKKSGLTLTFEHVTWKSIGIIYSVRATPAPSLVLIKWRGQKILSGQHLVYRPTDSCKTICPLFQGGHKKPYNNHSQKPFIYFMRTEWFLIWTNLNPLHPWMHCAKFGWNWPSSFGEEDFKISSIFFLFRNYLPLENWGPFIWTKLESPSTKDALCQVWLKLAQWFWRRRFLNFVNIFSLFHNWPP